MIDPQKRLHTLLTDGAVAGLSAAEAEELEALLEGEAIDSSYEQAAAAIELGLLDHTDPMPAECEAAVIMQAGRYWGFAEPRPREPTLGGAAGDFMLGAELEATPVSRQWDRSDDLVLESSLTNGRLDPLGRTGPGESMRGEILPDAVEERERVRVRVDPAAEAERREQFESEVDAQLDALERTSRPHVVPAAPPPARTDDDDDDDDDDDEFGLDDDDDDELEAPALAVVDPVGESGKSKRKPKPKPSQSAAAASLIAAPRDTTLSRWFTYVSAIAALLLLGLALWLFVGRNSERGPDVDELQANIEAQADKLEWSFTAKPDEAVGEAAGGTIAWSTELQAGVMVLRGLAANEPTTAQYQLWIVDSARADSPPVDGGVFDVAAGQAEVRVPVDAKLMVGKPAAFVITVEPPGGVVVSSQERVAMIAGPS